MTSRLLPVSELHKSLNFRVWLSDSSDGQVATRAHEGQWGGGTTTMGNVDALGKLGTVRQDGSGNTSGFAAEEARLLDELLASADLSSHETPEARPVHQLGDAGTPDDQGIESLEPTSEQLQAQAETTPPAAGDEPSSSAFTLTDTTAPNEDLETIEFEALHLNEIESEEQARTSLADTAQKSLEQPATMAPAWTYDYEAPTPQDAPANGAGPSAPVEA